MRTLVFGDIHGGLKALKQLLSRAKVSGKDKLIFLGDYVDGWSDSAEVMEFLFNLKGKQDCVFIKGNHDMWCEQWLKTRRVDSTWLLHGGRNTIQSYFDFDEKTKIQHSVFFELMEFYHVSEDNDLFIHAGFTSMYGPEREFYESNYSWDRTLWEMALAMDDRLEKDSILYPKRLSLFREIYIGHTPTIFFGSDKPMQATNLWNMDTGAGFTGKLSCMDIETKEIFQSDVAQTLYPDEKGRNKN